MRNVTLVWVFSSFTSKLLHHSPSPHVASTMWWMGFFLQEGVSCAYSKQQLIDDDREGMGSLTVFKFNESKSACVVCTKMVKYNCNKLGAQVLGFGTPKMFFEKQRLKSSNNLSCRVVKVHIIEIHLSSNPLNINSTFLSTHRSSCFDKQPFLNSFDFLYF